VDAKIILLHECTFRGALPGLLGAPGIRPLGHIGIGIIPVLLSSIDLKPSGKGLWPDSTPEGKARNLKLYTVTVFQMSSLFELHIWNYLRYLELECCI
jgi:hypothetical protein